MNYASVCDGIGAAHVAWEPLGWACQWTSEIEPFPAAVVEHHYGFRNLGDMTAITEEMLDAPVELLVGGTPCQSFSVAGLRKGLADPRGNLALRFIQLAAVLQPEWIVWENVPGVLSSGKGRDFGTFLGGLAELGYGFAYRILDAQWFGVAQRRRRVFVVGHLGDWRRAAAVLFERESVFGNPPTRGAAGEEATGTIAGCSNGGGANGPGRTADDADTLVTFGEDVARTLSARHDSSPCADRGMDVVAFHPTQDPISSTDGSTHAMGCGSTQGCCTQAVVAFDTTQITSCQNYSKPKAGDPCHPIAAGAHAPAVAVRTANTSANGHGVAQEVSHTIDQVQGQAVAKSMAVRRLTPRECERLQGFPDDYTLVTYRNKPAADGPRYKALGNSMAVPVMRWIGQRIAQLRRPAVEPLRHG